MKPIQAGRIKPKTGEIIFRQAYSKDDGIDWFCVWGAGVPRGDKNLVMQALASHKIFDYENFASELVRRGYDPATLKFSIKKLAASDDGDNEGEGRE